MYRYLRVFIICVCISFSSALSLAQEAITPRPSPLAIITMKYDDTYVKITYSQPHKRGREVFGSLVPYGKVWRTGANEATEITLTGDMLVGTDTLKAGTYSVFSVPNPDEWTIIFNKNLGQWGSYNYVEKADVMRLRVPVRKLEDEVYEPFTMAFDQKNANAELLMMWDDVKVALPLSFVTE